MLGLLAVQAGAAIGNAESFAQAEANLVAERRARRTREAVIDIAGTLLRERDGNRLLDQIAEAATDLLQVADAVVAVPDATGDGLRVVAARGRTAVVGATLPVRDSIIGTVLVASEPLAMTIGPRFADGRALIGADGVEVACVPIITAGDTAAALAVFKVAGDTSAFTAGDVSVLQALASVAALGLEIDRSFRRERQRADALARLRVAEAEAIEARRAQGRAVEVQEHERRRLARELHDSTAGSLASILLGLGQIARRSTDPEVVNDLDRVRAEMRATIEDVRDLIVDLRPKALDDFGLDAALERLCSGMARRGGLDISYAGDPALVSLGPDVATAVYRIVQEALTNALKHAEARSIEVRVALRDGVLTATVDDDGRGPGEAPSGFGRDGMEERARLINGRLVVRAGEKSGTRVHLEVQVP